MSSIVNIDSGRTSDENQSKYVKREVERLMVRREYEKGYRVYLTDPCLTTPMDFTSFVANNS